MEDRLLTIKEVLALVKVCRPVTLWKYVKEGYFTTLFKIAPKCNCWHRSDVDTWLAVHGQPLQEAA